MKRVYCLYRVSTKGQVDKNDIPMQKKACQEFASRNGWKIIKEYSEKGVSGYKVSADNRDAIQDLKLAAEKKEFDILLVFMFDRLGRIRDETPFVVEWFVDKGIEVWSSQEGQQSFENEVDYLVNYMRFWTANGESKKTSTRVKTRLAQLTEEGVYTGGNLPMGYKLSPSGNFNKKGKEISTIEIDPISSPIVKTIFEKTVQEGYGTHRLSTYLNNLGYRTQGGAKFQSNAVNRVLKSRMYCGYVISGDSSSPYIERLQIIDAHTFELAQKIREQRSSKYQEKQQIAMNTKGKTLLSGNIYCGHCGKKMNTTSSTDSYIRKDGSEYRSVNQRYICTGKAMKRNSCDGQGAYLAHKIDSAVETLILEYLEEIKTTPKDIALEKHIQSDIKALHQQLSKSTKELGKLNKRKHELNSEIGKSLVGDSKFTPDMLSNALNSSDTDIRETEQIMSRVQAELANQKDAFKKLDFHYEQFKSWSGEYMQASKEQQKMIACQLIKEIKVNRNYELDITFDLNYKQFIA